MRVIFLILSISITSNIFCQDFDEYNVDEIYQKIDLEYGTLDESGRKISFVFVKTELDNGNYEIDISDGPNDLYEINGTDLYISFRSYYGYAGYSDPGILEIDGYSQVFYKKL